MDTSAYSQRFSFDNAAVYRICVQGRIACAWADRLQEMEITAITLEGVSAVTMLEGEVRDQAALAGILNTLYEWHLPVLSVQRLAIGSADGRKD